MANNYCDMTGVLVLDKVTPVIQALFGPFNLDATYPGHGKAYIADISEESNTSWDAVADGLRELIRQLGLPLPEDPTHDVEQILLVLAEHFGASNDEALDSLIEQHRFEDDADLEALFEIARCFDDGHGMKAYKVEAAWHCSKPRLFEFGGAGEYCGSHVRIRNSSNQTVSLGEDLEAALTFKDLAQAAKRIQSEVDRILGGFTSEVARDAVRAKLVVLLSEVDNQREWKRE